MKKFPTLFIIVDIISGLVWKFGSSIGATIKGASGNIHLSIGKINLLGWLSALVGGIGSVFKVLGIVGEIVFFISLIITILLIVRFIVMKIKFRKMMKKVESMPVGGGVQAPVASATPIPPTPESGGPRELRGF